MEFIDTLQNNERRILELKTAAKHPSIFKTYTASFNSGATIALTDAPKIWTIHYKAEDIDDAPITYVDAFGTIYLAEFDPATNTQEIRVDLGDFNYCTIVSTREIESITQDSPLPPPPSIREWYQTVAFDSARMGTTPGWCEQNCRLGFGFAYGVFPTAMADKNSQQANGTLHSGTPPDYLQVPVYCDTGIPEGHVVVWDRGTVWEDGYILPNGLNTYAGHIYGWGELMDGRRVVEHI